MFTISVEAPTRIDIAGGTLDINPLYHILDRPVTVNMGIDLRSKVVISPRDSAIHRFFSHDQCQSEEGDILKSFDLKSCLFSACF